MRKTITLRRCCSRRATDQSRSRTSSSAFRPGMPVAASVRSSRRLRAQTSVAMNTPVPAIEGAAPAVPD